MKDKSILAGKYIYKILKESQDLQEAGLDENNIFPVIVRTEKYSENGEEFEKVDFPFLCYWRTSITPKYNKSYIIDNEVKYIFTVVSDDYEESLEIAEALRNQLEAHQYIDEDISIQNIMLEDATETEFEDAYVQTLNFTMSIM